MVTLRMSEDRYNALSTMLSMLEEFCKCEESCDECPVDAPCRELKYSLCNVWDGVNIIHDWRE